MGKIIAKSIISRETEKAYFIVQAKPNRGVVSTFVAKSQIGAMSKRQPNNNNTQDVEFDIPSWLAEKTGLIEEP
jgi:hypothetical protein